MISGAGALFANVNSFVYYTTEDMTNFPSRLKRSGAGKGLTRPGVTRLNEKVLGDGFKIERSSGCMRCLLKVHLASDNSKQ